MRAAKWPVPLTLTDKRSVGAIKPKNGSLSQRRFREIFPIHFRRFPRSSCGAIFRHKESSFRLKIFPKTITFLLRDKMEILLCLSVSARISFFLLFCCKDQKDVITRDKIRWEICVEKVINYANGCRLLSGHFHIRLASCQSGKEGLVHKFEEEPLALYRAGCTKSLWRDRFRSDVKINSCRGLSKSLLFGSHTFFDAIQKSGSHMFFMLDP